MALTKDDMDVLRVLVKQELDEIKKEDPALVNSPVLSGIYRMRETDLPFLKSKAEYVVYLQDLLQKLDAKEELQQND